MFATTTCDWSNLVCGTTYEAPSEETVCNLWVQHWWCCN